MATSIVCEVEGDGCRSMVLCLKVCSLLVFVTALLVCVQRC